MQTSIVDSNHRLSANVISSAATFAEMASPHSELFFARWVAVSEWDWEGEPTGDKPFQARKSLSCFLMFAPVSPESSIAFVLSLS